MVPPLISGAGHRAQRCRAWGWGRRRPVDRSFQRSGRSSVPRRRGAELSSMKSRTRGGSGGNLVAAWRPEGASRSALPEPGFAEIASGRGFDPIRGPDPLAEGGRAGAGGRETLREAGRADSVFPRSLREGPRTESRRPETLREGISSESVGRKPLVKRHVPIRGIPKSLREGPRADPRFPKSLREGPFTKSRRPKTLREGLSRESVGPKRFGKRHVQIRGVPKSLREGPRADPGMFEIASRRTRYQIAARQNASRSDTCRSGEPEPALRNGRGGRLRRVLPGDRRAKSELRQGAVGGMAELRRAEVGTGAALPEAGGGGGGGPAGARRCHGWFEASRCGRRWGRCATPRSTS